MAHENFICLSCGGHFTGQKQVSECPQCQSSNVMEITPANIFGMFTGGG